MGSRLVDTNSLKRATIAAPSAALDPSGAASVPIPEKCQCIAAKLFFDLWGMAHFRSIAIVAAGREPIRSTFHPEFSFFRGFLIKGTRRRGARAQVPLWIGGCGICGMFRD